MTPRLLSQLAAAFAIAAGTTVVLGWISGVPRLTDWTGGGITMKTNAGVAAIALGIALLLAAVNPASRLAVTLSGGFGALIGLLTLFQHASGIDLRIDTLLVDEPAGAAATASPNRMGPPASLSCFLLGSAVVMRSRDSSAAHRFAVGLSLTVLAMAMLSLTGHWFGAEALYGLPRLTGIATQTATLLAVLAVGTLALFPEHEPARMLWLDSDAGMLARRILPFMILVPLLLGLLRIRGQQLGYYDLAFGTALRTWVEIAILIALSWWGLRVIARRADERDQAEEALRGANRRKDVFLATLAHELRNPLAPVVTCARLLKRSDGPDASSEWAVDVIDRQVRHMARLLDDLLDASRVTHDRLELRLARIDLHAPLRVAIEAVRPAMDAVGHRLEIDLHPGSLGVRGDADRLTQIFSNVLHNAMKYTPAGGRIRVRTGVEGQDAVVVISDDGEGIAAAALPQVFEMFVQGHVAGERAQGGLGIGLALVRALVSLHGGRVEAHSDGPGRGSAFTIRLPRR